jgi:starch synthase
VSEADPLAILMVASEATPYSKTGGLADVAGSLPRALDRLGHRVTLVVPRYRGIDRGAKVASLGVTIGGTRHDVDVLEDAFGARSRALLLDCPPLYDRDELYGVGSSDYGDNALRFAVFARAALDTAVRAGERPAVVHAHDWQGGLAPFYLKTRYATDQTLGGVPAVFTIHNLAYQGVFDSSWLAALDLGPDAFTPAALEFWGRISFLKGGIQFSEAITTVSPRYAKEILTREGGFGFEGVLAAKKGDLIGILNGIDVEVWSPDRDPFLPAPFDAVRLENKEVSKRALLSVMKLPPVLDRPVIGMVSRMVEQKGHHLVVQVAEALMSLEATFVVLGSGERRFEEFWTMLSRRYPDRVGVHIGYHERLAHLIEGGADMFLMPSLFEPCGLNQMYSQRYGTVPIVRATGGLDDTVENYDERTERGTGFKFSDATGDALLGALRRALAVYGQSAKWRGIQKTGMGQDYSWDVSAREYVKVYRRVVREGRPVAARRPTSRPS